MAEGLHAAGKGNAEHMLHDHSTSKCPEEIPKKRKRPATDDPQCDNTSFDAVPVEVEAQKSQPVTFTSVMYVPKVDFPLLWLDTSSKPTRVQGGSLFHASLPEQDNSGPAILVARLVPNGGLYAIDHVSHDVIVVYCLRAWVKEEYIKDQALGRWSREQELEQILHRAGKESSNLTGPLLGVAAHGDAQMMKRSPRKPRNRKGVLARLEILPTTANSPDEAASATAKGPNAVLSAGSGANSAFARPTLMGEVLPLTDPLTVDESGSATALESNVTTLDLDELRRQYLETLYLSKTSLAYFAKGPLTRARNQVQKQIGENAFIELDAFYGNSILTGKKFDLKFRDTVPSALSTGVAPTSVMDDPVPASDSVAVCPKKRRSKKRRLGKDCLYPGEHEYLMRCWQDREIGNALHVTADGLAQEARKFTAELRSRESQMQILLILECLTLEKMQHAHDQTRQEDRRIKEEPVEHEGVPRLARTPSKKRDLSRDLDMLMDRLCIWHTVGGDDMLDSPEKQDTQSGSSSQVKDKLRGFCADVIIPFYASRIPEKCRAICKKLGGPDISTDRPKARKAASAICAAPGTSVKNRPRSVAKRTLERVLSEDHGLRHATPPLLSRSATAPLIPRLKRESSEGLQRPASRGAMHKSVSFLNREIDLTADAKAQEAKRRKTARLSEQKQELQAAIHALKKPNRTAVAGGFMDEVERRVARTTEAVQITATPRRRKPSNSMLESAMPPEDFEATHEMTVPTSTIRPRAPLHDLSQPRSSTAKRAVLVAIHGTPSKRTANVSHPLRPATGPMVESTPIISRLRPDWLTGVESTPLRMTKSQKPLSLTPLNKADVTIEAAFRDAPEIPEQAGKAMDRVMGGGVEVSIYDSLGWDDDIDE